LQSKIDQLISDLGSEGLINFLEIVNMRPDFEERVCTFVLYSVSIYYKMSIEEFIKDKSKTDVEPRMIISHLLKVYLKYSVRRIGKVINRKEEPVNRYLKDSKFFLEKPQFNVKFVANYRILENQLKEFIQFIEYQNTTKDGERKKDQEL
jgi:hypothetical protein